MQTIETIIELHKAREAITGRVGAVYTMGALHKGHLALIEQARAENDQVIATIFVNPTQFAPQEDFSTYPRSLEQDLQLLRDAKVDVVFNPLTEIMYPPNYQTYVEVGEIARGLEGMRRPGFFRGVATIVTKLLNLTEPHNVYFGQKDAQQVAVIKQMVRDLNYSLKVIVCPTVRDEDGLALSSRNAYLDKNQRRAAPVLYRALQAAADLYEKGERTPKALRLAAQKVLIAEPTVEMEYVSAADAVTLNELFEATEKPLLLSMAVRVGKARLIDNLVLPAALNNRDDLTRILGGA
jgi:pantoate--beta-alanine ligase